MIYNTTLDTASWVSVDSKSGVEYDLTAGTSSGGITLFTTFTSANAQDKDIDLSNFFSYEGRLLRLQAFTNTSDILTVWAANDSGANAAAQASLTWGEIR